MLSLPASVRVFLCLVPVDMRLSFDRLAALAGETHDVDPLSGHLFVFHSRRRDRVKILYWDRDGMALWYKRLEAGTFPFPSSSAASLSVTPAELSMLLDGVNPSTVTRRKRFSLEKAQNIQ
jgi:transposase